MILSLPWPRQFPRYASSTCRFDWTRPAALGQHLALDHADHVRAELHDEVHVVLDHDEAAALRLVQLDQQLAQLIDQARD